jgi:hypothetical protein
MSKPLLKAPRIREVIASKDLNKVTFFLTVYYGGQPDQWDNAYVTVTGAVPLGMDLRNEIIYLVNWWMHNVHNVGYSVVITTPVLTFIIERE